MSWKHAALVAMAVCGFADAGVVAQRVAPPRLEIAPMEPDADVLIASGELQGQINVIALDPVNVGRTVRNAPYSAEAVTEVTQTLTDGNRIEQRTSAVVARDSRGRTRREQHGVALGSFVAQSDEALVTITDPGTGTHITLNYAQKIAFRAKPVRVTLTDADVQARGPVAFSTYTQAPRSLEGGPVPPPPPPPPPGVAGPPEDMIFTKSAIAGAPAIAGVAAAAAVFDADVKTETLEPRTIEGLRAEGTRTTTTIAAGAMGNALPIAVTNEQWYSPELEVVLETRRVDPRFGETIYRLTNINRSEPSPDLFTIPADFKIEDMRPGKPVPPPRPDPQ